MKPTVTANQKFAGGLYFGKSPPAEKTRHYFIAAEPVLWEWVPGGKNTTRNAPLPPQITAQPSVGRLHYVEYTDATFSAKATAPEHLGITGPVLRGVTGEYLAVTFFNNTGTPLSIHPHGVRYDKDSEGAYYLPDPGLGSAVGPGAKFTYVWHLDDSSGTQADEPSSKCWLYHSHCKNDEELSQGLVGMIVVTDPKRARPDGTPSDVDREFATIFQILEVENESQEEVLEAGGRPPSFAQVLEGKDNGARHTINGRMFGTLGKLEMNEGERVRWYLAAVGDETSLHTVHWHGARLREGGGRMLDVVSLLPAETKVADMLADNPGTWLLQCHVSDHMMDGMFAPYKVLPKESATTASAFFSQQERMETLRWESAEGKLNFAPGAETPVNLILKGSVPVFRGFFLKGASASLMLGGVEQKLSYAGKGRLGGSGISLQALNVNPYDVALDSRLDFEIHLSGASWLEAFGQSDVSSSLMLGAQSATSAKRLKVMREGSTAVISLP